MDQFQLSKTDVLQNTPAAQAAGQKLSEESWGQWASEHKLLVGAGIAAGIAVVAVGGYYAYRSISNRLAQRGLASAASAELGNAALSGSKPVNGLLLDWAATNLQKPAVGVADLAVQGLKKPATATLADTALTKIPTPSSSLADSATRGLAKPVLADSAVKGLSKPGGLVDAVVTGLPKPTAEIGERTLATGLPKPSSHLAPGQVVEGAYSWGATEPARVAASKGLNEVATPMVSGDSSSLLAQIASGNTNAVNQYVKQPMLEHALETLSAAKARQRAALEAAQAALRQGTNSAEGTIHKIPGAVTSDLELQLLNLERGTAGTGGPLMDDFLRNGNSAGTAAVDKSLSRHIPAISGFDLPILKK